MAWWRAGFLSGSVMTLVAAAFIVPLPLYLESPGRVVSLAACVDVEHEAVTGVEGDYLLTTISVLRSTTYGAVTGIIDDEVAVVGRRQVLPPGVDTRHYFRQQREVFAASADVAAAVGLQAAGVDAEVTGDGVEVVEVLPDGPADGILQPGDVIVAVGGASVEVEAQLRDAIATATAGEPLTLTVQRAGESVTLEVVPELIQDMPLIGILPATSNARVDLPFDVDVASGAIGGPSAGLMIALTVYDKVLPEVDLAAGRVIAGTGSIDQLGRVGPIGGIGLKVIAADREEADVFLAPLGNHQEAVAAVPVGSSLRVVPVETFDDALTALQETRGEQPRSPDAQPPACPYPKAA